MVRLSKKYRRIYHRLTNFELQKTSDDEKLISSEDIFGELTEKKRPHLFLNFYSELGIKKALDTYGVFEMLEKKGFHDFIVKIDTDDPYRHILKVYFEKEQKDHLLGEMYARMKVFIAKPTFSADIANEKFNLIFIEWISLQNSSACFTKHRPPLPGQSYPGLRIGRKVLDILINMAIRLKSDGLLNTPEHYHNAVFYSKCFFYFNPETQGQLLAMQRDFKQYRLDQAAWAVELNCIVEKNTQDYWEWGADEQVLPVSYRMEKYFDSDEYKRRVSEAKNKYHFTIEREKYNERIRQQEAGKFVAPIRW